MRAPIFYLCLLLSLLGCKKKEEPVAATEPAPADTSPAFLTNAQPAAVELPAPAADPAALLAELTQLVRRFGLEQQRVPKNLDELVAKGYLARLPDAPPGKKFAINSKMEVVLGSK